MKICPFLLSYKIYIKGKNPSKTLISFSELFVALSSYSQPPQMATQTLSRSLSKPKTLTSFLFPSSRSLSSFSSAAAASPKTLITPSPPPSLSFLRRLRAPPCFSLLLHDSLSPAFKSFSARAARSSLSDPNPNYSNRPPKETILLDGCDFEHWLIVVEPPKEDATRDDIIASYIKTLAQVVGRYNFLGYFC